MVKIKDFTLASKNLGGGHVLPPPVPNNTPAHDTLTYLIMSLLQWNGEKE